MQLVAALQWATRLSDPEQRGAALAELAMDAGARHALLLVGDDDGRVMLPAPGLRQTLPRGACWRALLHELWAGGTVRGEVEALPGSDGTGTTVRITLPRIVPPEAAP